MATLYIAEYAGIAGDHVQVPLEPAIAEQTVSIGGSSTACTNGFKSETRFVRIHTDTTCSIVFGANPTATTANKRLAADQTEVFGVYANHKVAVISNT